MQTTQYWAALPSEEVVKELASRRDAYFEQLIAYGHMRKIEKSYEMYHGIGEYDPSYIGRGGEKGELLRVKINELRSLINHVLVLTTQNRPALKSVAINNDFDAQQGAKLGDHLVDYYFKSKHLEHIVKSAVELALVTSKGYVVLRWNTQDGNEYGATEDGRVVYDGDIGAGAYSCLDVIEDIFAKESTWWITQERRNKFDLAAQFPEQAERILTLDGVDRVNDFRYNNVLEQDTVWHYTFYHRKTPALPNGRIVEFVGDDILLTDGPLPYKDVMIHPILPGKVQGTQLGYTPAFDLLSLNDALNSAWSAFITNIDTFGVSNVWIPSGSNISASQLPGGLNVIESDTKPEVIDLVKVNEAVFKVTDLIKSQMQAAVGVNDVIRGNPEANLRSGNSMALVAAQALVYNSGLQASLANLLAQVGTSIVRLLQDFATTPKMAAIVGQGNQSLLKSFTGSDLQGIDRVVIEEVSAVSRTTAGKLELATNLLQQGLIQDPADYLNVIETGRMDPLTHDKVQESLAIQRENELLRDGSLPVQAVLTENHQRHIKGHAAVLSDPFMKTDPAVVQRVLAHIQEHIDLGMSPQYQQMAPLLGHQPIPMPPAPVPPMGPEAAPPGDVIENPENVENLPSMPTAPDLPPGAPPELQEGLDQAMSQGIPQ